MEINKQLVNIQKAPPCQLTPNLYFRSFKNLGCLINKPNFLTYERQYTTKIQTGDDSHPIPMWIVIDNKGKRLRISKIVLSTRYLNDFYKAKKA